MELLKSNNISGILQNSKGTLIFEVFLLVASVLASVALLFIFIIPQFQSFLTMNEEVSETRSRIAAIQSNLQLVRSLDDTVLDRNFVTAATALPVDKDYSGAMQSILAASVNSGASLEKFSFSVGTIVSRSAVPTADTVPVLTIGIKVLGDTKTIKDYITSLYTYLPLSKITVADSNNEKGSSIIIEFPSQPLPELAIKNDSPIQQTTAKNKEVLQMITEWKEKGELTQLEDTGSTSADMPPPF